MLVIRRQTDKTIFVCLAVGLVFFCFHSFLWAASPTACIPEDQRWQNSLVKVRTNYRYHATGIVLRHNQVLTVLHALPVGAPIFVEWDGRLLAADLLKSHEGADLALLVITEGEVDPAHVLSLGVQDLQLSESVWAMGFGLDGDRELVSGQYLKRKLSGLMASTPIEPGFSGGALIHCEQGEPVIAGLIHSQAVQVQKNRVINSGLSVSVPASIIQNFLR